MALYVLCRPWFLMPWKCRPLLLPISFTFVIRAWVACNEDGLCSDSLLARSPRPIYLFNLLQPFLDLYICLKHMFWVSCTSLPFFLQVLYVLCSYYFLELNNNVRAGWHTSHYRFLGAGLAKSQYWFPWIAFFYWLNLQLVLKVVVKIPYKKLRKAEWG